MDIRRFGPGHRRADGPQGTKGVTGQMIHHDDHGLVSELAFQRFAMITPHSNPNMTLFIVISGGGHVQVGDERVRVNHGEAIVWPPNVPHGAYTDGSEMRAIVIELPRGGDTMVLEGAAAEVLGSGIDPPTAAADPGTDLPTGQPPADLPTGQPPADLPTDQAPADPPTDRPPAAHAAAGRPKLTRAEGRLADRQPLRDEYDTSQGEPW